ncbi:hypothetical protein VB773_13700 [Haloarculaceae archaeon H-GB2-1]|nr:hypothetical protein [Haloarculaceae archaeon H-GB1-1]MEA5387017.1 hypothetical protein [Haloarculaceae archaeon H-GB11]MEA5408519.1 hypothetical protein [Haloarculaceae archaeon H-GB2-1]
MSRPLYECAVCGTPQPADDRVSDEREPPEQLHNVSCRHKYGGCVRMVTMDRVPDREWDPVYWELFCFNCQYETVSWGREGFGDSRKWTCPDCGNGMQVLTVEQSWESDE